MPTIDPDPDPQLNIVVLRGVASAPPELRCLPSGRRLATVSIRVPGSGPQRTSVPVAVWDPPEWLAEIDTADGLVVVGVLRRRFFQASGSTGSRVEVEASLIGRDGDRRRRAAARRRVDDALDALA